MLGAIIGDTCGSVYEFNNLKNYNKIKFFKRGCRPTDDSYMTISVAKALMDTYGKPKEVTKEAVIDSMHYFGHMYPTAGYGGHFATWLFLKKREPYNSWGNGSAMRVSSAGWLYDTLEETLEYAKLTSEVTHNHPDGIKGAEATAAAIYFARKGYDKEQIRTEMYAKFGYELNFTIEEIRPTYSFDVSCQGTLPVALEAFLESKDFEDAIRLALSVGGDSDTIACITGSIAEAFYGIPEYMVNKEMDILKRHEKEKNPILTKEISRFYERING